jgi:hypothetical protein
VTAPRAPASAPDPTPARGRRDLAWILGAFAVGLAAFLLMERRLAGPVGAAAFPLDDSWIHLQFARNLAEGHGFSYNPGVPVAGSTAPLWTLVLAGLFAVLGSHAIWVKLAGIAAGLATVLLTRRLATSWTGDPALGVLAAVLTALAGPMLWGALSGMEVTLAALLVTAALCVDGRGPDWATALLLGLACLARPEALLVVPLLWLARPVTIRRTLAFGIVVGALLAPWVAFNLATTGTPLPATATAKIEGGLVGLFTGAREPRWKLVVRRPAAFVGEWALWLLRVNALVPLLLLPGLAALRRKGDRALVVPALVLLLHPLGMAFLAPYRGPAFQTGRYSMHLLPLAITVAVAALAPFGWPVAGPWRRRVTAGLVLAALVSTGYGAYRYGWAVQNIDAMQVHLGRWVAHEAPPEARIALNDVGAIAYLSRREVIDLMGLVTPEIRPYRRDGDRGILRYLERSCPDYLIVFPKWFGELVKKADYFTPVYRIRLDHNTVAGADEMVVYETTWNRWRPSPRSCG